MGWDTDSASLNDCISETSLSRANCRVVSWCLQTNDLLRGRNVAYLTFHPGLCVCPRVLLPSSAVRVFYDFFHDMV